MAETTLRLKGGLEEIELIEKANKYYNSFLPKWYEMKENNTIDIILRHPEREDGFVLKNKKEHNIEDILEALENHRKTQSKRQIDYTSSENQDAYLTAYADYIAKTKYKIMDNRANQTSERLSDNNNQLDLSTTKVKFHHEDTDFIRRISEIVNEDKQIYYSRAEKLDDNTYEIDLIHPKELNAKEIVDDFVKQTSLNHNNENKNQNNMAQGEFNQQEYLEKQVKYLGFGESKEIKDQIKSGIEGAEKEFQVQTTSDKVMKGNSAEFSLNFKKDDKGGVFLNSYDAKLTTKKGEERTHSFPVNRSNNITAKEAINLLEGRAVKAEFTNKETGEINPAFIKLKLKEDKNQYGNYQMEYYNKNYGVDTAQIMDKSNLKFNDDIQRERTQKSLEKGNITKVTFKDGNNGFAILNPQYKMLNLYDEKMNRVNTNKEAPKVEIQDNQKNNVREQSQRRSL
ncbi:hypothetical protein EDL98_10955 [Ornithobacterium rhinotracheale]|uniref:hypothetical protein n=2 Tax=Ornithobacterium rhinotracheale TaxID=28251 RepID=UPI00129C4832|nr:hypothetical protein [Ornithobacterium rhinotracheale]MRJ11583.1 hypothetical protein [Ornithobacterium rhinotracheale]